MKRRKCERLGNEDDESNEKRTGRIKWRRTERTRKTVKEDKEKVREKEVGRKIQRKEKNRKKIRNKIKIEVGYLTTQSVNGNREVS
jgi:hypothetical protein